MRVRVNHVWSERARHAQQHQQSHHNNSNTGYRYRTESIEQKIKNKNTKILSNLYFCSTTILCHVALLQCDVGRQFEPIVTRQCCAYYTYVEWMAVARFYSNRERICNIYARASNSAHGCQRLYFCLFLRIIEFRKRRTKKRERIIEWRRNCAAFTIRDLSWPWLSYSISVLWWSCDTPDFFLIVFFHFISHSLFSLSLCMHITSWICKNCHEINNNSRLNWLQAPDVWTKKWKGKRYVC